MPQQRTEQEIHEQMDLANTDDTSKWPGMTYEQGVHEALSWILGHDHKPMDD